MFQQALDLANAILYHVSFAYAALVSVQRLREGAEISTVNNSARQYQIVISVLRLWIMLTILASMSLFGLGSIPLFREVRIILICLLLFMSPAAQGEVFDTVFATPLAHLSKFSSIVNIDYAHAIPYICIHATDTFLSVTIVLVHILHYSRAVSESDVHDILAGLQSTRQSLRHAISELTNRIEERRAETYRQNGSNSTVSYNNKDNSNDLNSADILQSDSCGTRQPPAIFHGSEMHSPAPCCSNTSRQSITNLSLSVPTAYRVGAAAADSKLSVDEDGRRTPGDRITSESGQDSLPTFSLTGLLSDWIRGSTSSHVSAKALKEHKKYDGDLSLNSRNDVTPMYLDPTHPSYKYTSERKNSFDKDRLRQRRRISTHLNLGPI